MPEFVGVAPPMRSMAALHPQAMFVVQWTTFFELKEYKFATTVRGFSAVVDLRELLFEIDLDIVDFWPFSWAPETSKQVLNSTRRFWSKHPSVKRELVRELWNVGYEERL